MRLVHAKALMGAADVRKRCFCGANICNRSACSFALNGADACNSVRVCSNEMNTCNSARELCSKASVQNHKLDWREVTCAQFVGTLYLMLS